MEFRGCLVVLAMCGIVGIAGAQPSGDIAYLNGPHSGNLTVCVLHLGSEAVDIVGTGQNDGRPVWSPNGERLAHAFDTDGVRRIRVVDADGGNENVLAIRDGDAFDPQWSPDGARIAFVAGAPGAERIQVYEWATGTMELWGGTTVPLMQPEWVSADRLAAIGRLGKPGSQTTDLFWVTQRRADRIEDALPEHGKYLEWAPASPHVRELLAFESDDGGDREIYVYAPQRGAIDVSNHRAADWNPKWSPDRRTIAFESFRSGRRGIYQVNALRVLVAPVATPPESDAWDPDWSPDGKWIVHVSNHTGDANLFVSRANGEETIQISDSPGVQLAPAWRPSP